MTAPLPPTLLAYPRSGTVEAAESVIPLAVVLVAAPMAQGGAPAWAWHALAVAMGINLGWWAVCALRAPTPVGLSWRRHGITTALGCILLAWLALQAMSMEALPEAWRHPVWRDASAALRIEIVGGISADPDASWDAFIRMTLYAATFWIAMHYARPPDGSRRLLAVIAAAGALYGAMGLVLWAAGVGPHFEPADGGVAGPFPDADGMAVYLGLCLTAAAALLSSRRTAAAVGGIVGSFDPRRIVVGPARDVVALAPAIIAIAAALVLTGSPVGWIVAIVGLAILVTARALTERVGLGVSVLLGVAVSAVGLVAVHLYGGDAPLSGIDLSAAALGRGLGVAPFPPGIDSTLDSATLLSGGVETLTSRNGVVEWAAQAGLPAAVLLLGILGWVAAACARGCFASGEHAAYAAAGLATMGVLACQSVLNAEALTPAAWVTGIAAAAVGFSRSWPDDEDAGA